MPIGSLLRVFFIFLPLIEIAGFILVGSLIGVLPTLLLIIATSVLGASILRGQSGIHQLRDIQQRVRNRVPLTELEVPMLMLAGMLLLIPGFVTDIMGLLLFIPLIRRMILHWLLRKGLVQQAPPAYHHETDQGDMRTIEGEFRREDDSSRKL